MAVFTNAPLWVWPLLAVLVGVGVNAMRTRQAPIFLLYLLPFLGILSLRSVLSLEPALWVWGGFALAYGLGALFGMPFQRARILAKTARRVHLRGEALTLVAVLVLFSANFVVGVLGAVAPELLLSAVFQAGFAATLGLVSGSFLGRAIAIARTPLA